MSDDAACTYNSNDVFVDDDEALRTLAAVCASFSLVGCTFIIFTYFFFAEARTSAYRIVFFLGLSNWISALPYLIGSISIAADSSNFCGGFWCGLASYLMTFADIAGIIWVGCIGFNVYLVLTRAFNGSQGNKTGFFSSSGSDPEKYYHISAWGLAVLGVFIGAVSSEVGPTGPWCWFQNTYTQIFVFYFPAFFVFFSIVFLYLRTAQMIAHSPLETRVTSRLRMYLVCYLVVNFFALLSRIVDWATGEPSNVLLFFHASLFPLQGFIYSMIYAKHTHKIYKEWWARRSTENSSGFVPYDSGIEMA